MIADEGDVGDDEEFWFRSPWRVLVNHSTNALNLLLADAYDYLLGTTCREVLRRGHYAIALVMNGKNSGALALTFFVKPPSGEIEFQFITFGKKCVGGLHKGGVIAQCGTQQIALGTLPNVGGITFSGVFRFCKITY